MKSYTILYIDDDHDDLMLLAEAFEKYTDHLRVVHAYNGHEGIQVLDSMRRKGSLPCLVILDINMPVMNGKEALKQIRANPAYHNIPVVIFSTSNNALDKKFAEGLGAEFITKPISYIDMESLVAEFISKCKFEATQRA